jgi:predicted phosphodiesterase
MSINVDLDDIYKLVIKGTGRRRIAQKYGITEWKARKLIRQAVESNFVPERDDKDTKKQKKEVSKRNIVPIRVHSKVKPTKISVKSACDNTPVPHKVVTRDASLKVAVLSDIHYPYEDEKACEVTDMFLEDWKPDVIVYNGDICDCYSISSYEKSIHKKMNIQQELDYANEKLDARDNRLSSVRETYVLEGNHEDRFNRLLSKEAKQLTSLRGLNIQSSLDIDGLGFNWIGGHEELYIGKLMFVHGHMIRKHAGSTARGHFEQYGTSVCIGHCHRLSIGYKRNKQGNHTLIENGTLCDFDVEYAKYPDWQHGFTTIEFDNDDFAAVSRPIHNYKLIADGKIYAI